MAPRDAGATDQASRNERRKQPNVGQTVFKGIVWATDGPESADEALRVGGAAQSIANAAESLEAENKLSAKMRTAHRRVEGAGA